MLEALITMGSPAIGEVQKKFELRISQENKETCE